MEIRWLEDFIALARTRHFSRAADEQNVTQPTFSRRIKLLEEEMRVTLVDRNTLPLTLTPAGEIFLQSAEQITRQIREAKARCQAIKEQDQSTVRLVTTQSLLLGYFRDVFEPLCQKLELTIEVNMQASSWPSSMFIDAINGNECDVMLCFWHPAMDFFAGLDPEHVEFILLDKELLIPCVAADNAGQPRHQLPGTRQKPLPYIAYDDGAFLAPVVSEYLKRQPEMAQLQVQTSDLHAASIKALVKEGFGIGWLPERLVTDSLQFGSLVKAGDTSWHIPLEIRLYRDKRNTHPKANQFWQRLQATISRQE